MLAIATIGLAGAMAADLTLDQSPASAPRAMVAENIFVFDEVTDGETVTHAFVIENRGTAPLKIEKVQTSCGCTMAKRPKTVEPGMSGEIEVEARTRGYGGHVFNKTITVFTNDPLAPRFNLTLKGRVGLFARIDPSRIVLRGKAGASLEAKATITPNAKHPFRILKVTADHGLTDKINVQLSEDKGRYLLIVHNRQATPGRYRGRVVFKTDSALQPQLILYVTGDIKA